MILLIRSWSLGILKLGSFLFEYVFLIILRFFLIFYVYMYNVFEME